MHFAKRAEKKFRLFLFRNAMAKGKAHSAESSGAKASRERALHEFEKQFERDHPDFAHLFTERCPDVKKQELRICKMLRCSMDEGEICYLLGIVIATLDNHRSSIRKKLGLERKQNLDVFIMHF